MLDTLMFLFLQSFIVKSWVMDGGGGGPWNYNVSSWEWNPIPTPISIFIPIPRSLTVTNACDEDEDVIRDMIDGSDCIAFYEILGKYKFDFDFIKNFFARSDQT